MPFCREREELSSGKKILRTFIEHLDDKLINHLEIFRKNIFLSIFFEKCKVKMSTQD